MLKISWKKIAPKIRGFSRKFFAFRKFFTCNNTTIFSKTVYISLNFRAKILKISSKKFAAKFFGYLMKPFAFRDNLACKITLFFAKNVSICRIFRIAPPAGALAPQAAWRLRQCKLSGAGDAKIFNFQQKYLIFMGFYSLFAEFF